MSVFLEVQGLGDYLPGIGSVDHLMMARDILVARDRRGMVGGQEDKIKDTALTMAKARGLAAWSSRPALKPDAGRDRVHPGRADPL